MCFENPVLLAGGGTGGLGVTRALPHVRSVMDAQFGDYVPSDADIGDLNVGRVEGALDLLGIDRVGGARHRPAWGTG